MLRQLCLSLVLLAQPRVYDPAATGGNLRTYTTDHYTIHTDVSEDAGREVRLRLDRMFDEYARRTSDFAKPTTARLPFYLFTKEADYLAAGGMENTAGVFMVTDADKRLMARYTGDRRTWHTTQHEGFHQFAFLSIAPNLPPWVNEGLAEYFGEAIYTGDAMLSGLIPDYRRQRIVQLIQSQSHIPFATFLNLDIKTWNEQMSLVNYDQAWSMVQFMAEGDSGRYQKAFLSYMRSVAKGNTSARAWADATGNANPADFETAWKRYWLNLPPSPTSRLYSQARLMILTSFLARAAQQGQQFKSLREFTSSAIANQLSLPDSASPFWLPPKLLEPALEEVASNATYTLSYAGTAPRLARTYADGTTITVTYVPPPRSLRDSPSGGRTLVDVRPK